MDSIDSFKKVIDFNNLYNAYLHCRKNVKWKTAVQNFSKNSVYNIKKIQEQLMNDSFKFGRYTKFKINERGKEREVVNIAFSERIVQQSFCDNVLNPIIIPRLIYDSGSCIKGKGISFTRKRLKYHLSNYYKKYGNCGYILLIDFKKYFNNIDHKILLKNIYKYIKDNKNKKLLYDMISPEGDKGLCLGSQVSQILALFYASILDHYIKDKLRVKYYGRYMDDSYIISNSKKYLKYILILIKKFCKNNLNLELNSKKTCIQKLNNFKFIKCVYSLKPSGKIITSPDKKSFKRICKRIKKIKKNINLYKGYMKYFNNNKYKIKFKSLLISK